MNNMKIMHPINDPSDPSFLHALIRTASGQQKAGLVIKNCTYLNVFTGEWLRGDIALCGKLIAGIGEYAGETEIDATNKTCVPGFIDGHIHLESAMVTPLEFTRAVLPRGTTAVIADPHEIANVLGTAGIDYMLSATENLPMDVLFMMPSCVPATRRDENGATIGLRETARYLKHPRVLGLGEMMDYLGVLSAAPNVLSKISAAQALYKKVDGHAPGLHGKDLNAYIAAGINTDHECVSAEEAFEKLRLGQWIMIREGTAGRNLTALLPLFQPPYSTRCLMVTDDKHPGDLINLGHIDHMVRKAITLGADPAAAYTMASHNAARCFHLNRLGAIAPGYQADFLLVDDVDTVAIHSVYKAGKCVFSKGFDPALPECKNAPTALHAVNIGDITESSFRLDRERVIGLIPGELITTDEGYADVCDTARDIIKIAVVERHRGTGHMGKAYLKGYGLQAGAIALSIAHDAHNLIVAGVSDADMALAVHRIACMQGGMVMEISLPNSPCPSRGSCAPSRPPKSIRHFPD
jgi:adenine deaminase